MHNIQYTKQAFDKLHFQFANCNLEQSAHLRRVQQMYSVYAREDIDKKGEFNILPFLWANYDKTTLPAGGGGRDSRFNLILIIS